MLPLRASASFDACGGPFVEQREIEQVLRAPSSALVTAQLAHPERQCVGFVGDAAKVFIPSSAVREVVAVPRDALVLREDNTYVFKVNGKGVALEKPRRYALDELDLSSGKKARLYRMMYEYGPANGTLLFLPIDQGLEHGPHALHPEAPPLANDVLICFGSGLPSIFCLWAPVRVSQGAVSKD